MTERGMIFNGEMVRALLDDRKTQTRRPVKFPVHDKNLGCELAGNELAGELSAGNYLNSAFGKPGDRIWVRETWAILGNEDGCCIDWEEKLCKADERSAARIYRASCEQRPGNYGLWSIPDDADWKPHTKDYQYEGAWRPSIHMPRWASRILLEITNVRVERLNSISEEDAQAEGMELTGWRPTYSDPDSGGEVLTPYDNFAQLWESIYGEESWKANPWVWVIEFKRVEGGEA
ncbi:hypothetical protein M4C97_10190 [Klebsiella pneumoniae]|nr:hypothetical protein [Klebsiella pneumoniae]